jgi:hypothetical protein
MGRSPEGAVLNFVIRMVVPMRREFGRLLDVQRFMRDADYARIVLDEALESRDQRLRDYAEYVLRHLGGAREVDPPSAPPVVAAQATLPDTVSAPVAPERPAPPARGSADLTEAELRDRMLKKYTGGLR